MGLDTSGIRPKEGRLGYLSLIGKAAVPKTASRGPKLRPGSSPGISAITSAYMK